LRALALQFALENDSNFEFYVDWDWNGFQDIVEARDDDANMMDVVNGIVHPSIDKAILWCGNDDPISSLDDLGISVGDENSMQKFNCPHLSSIVEEI
jgi:hypothetical protein